MLRATLKSLFARKVRLLLSALAVVAGVSFVTGTLILTDTLNRGFESLFNEVTAKVSVSVRTVNAVGGISNDRLPVPASLVETVSAVDGVKSAVGIVEGQAVLIDPETGDALKTGGAPSIGTNWTGGADTSNEVIVEGRPPGPGEIVVDKASANRFDLRVGQRLSVQGTGQPEEFTLVGTYRIGERDGLGGALVTAFETATAQRILLAPDQFTEIYLAAEDGVGQEELRARVAAVLPEGTEAITGEQLAEENASAVQEAIGGFSTYLLVFAGIAVFVGAFIIFNTFTMLVAQRVRELALLRAIGASRWQIQFSVQVEAALVGFVGATAGLVLGTLLAVVLRIGVQAFGIALPADGLVFQPRTAVVAYAVGLLITAAAAFVPARKASSVPPVAALRETYVLPARSLRIRAIGGAALTGVGAIMLVVGLASGENPSTMAVGIGAALVFLGIATLSPLLAPPVTKIIGIPLRVLFGITGRLGQENAMRNPRRTASTASALMIGLALVSAFAVLGQSIKQSVRDTVSRSLGADFLLTGSGGFGQAFSSEVGRQLVGKPGIAHATGLRGGMVTVFDGEPTAVVAGEPEAMFEVLAIEQAAGDIAALGEGSILVNDEVAAERGLQVGQKIPITFPDGPTELTLVGTYQPNDVAGDWLVSTSEFAKHSNNNLDLFVLVKMAEGADPEQVRAEIEAVAEPFGNVEVRNQSEFVAHQAQQVDMMLNIIYVLLALAVVIALIGIVNTLALSVIERTREIGMLRAVGMTRPQMRRMIIFESVIIAVFGAVLGVLVGSFFGWALTNALRSQGVTSFAYPADTIITVMIVGAVLGVLAALFPARRAARMDVLRAISTT